MTIFTFVKTTDISNLIFNKANCFMNWIIFVPINYYAIVAGSQKIMKTVIFVKNLWDMPR